MSKGQYHLSHLTILRRFSWHSLAYMYTKVALHFILFPRQRDILPHFCDRAHLLSRCTCTGSLILNYNCRHRGHTFCLYGNWLRTKISAQVWYSTIYFKEQLNDGGDWLISSYDLLLDWSVVEYWPWSKISFVGYSFMIPYIYYCYYLAYFYSAFFYFLTSQSACGFSLWNKIVF